GSVRRGGAPGGPTTGRTGGTGAAGRTSGERVQVQAPEGADRTADPVRPARPPAGAGGPGGEAVGRDRPGQELPVPVRLLPRHRLPLGRPPGPADSRRRPAARP